MTCRMTINQSNPANSKCWRKFLERWKEEVKELAKPDKPVLRVVK